ncbi:hypothetical protein EMCRGX_G024086 [Ephydatia muelleri]
MSDQEFVQRKRTMKPTTKATESLEEATLDENSRLSSDGTQISSSKLQPCLDLVHYTYGRQIIDVLLRNLMIQVRHVDAKAGCTDPVSGPLARYGRTLKTYTSKFQAGIPMLSHFRPKCNTFHPDRP